MATGLHAQGHQVLVVPLYVGGALEGELRFSGVPVRSPEKKGRWDLFGFFGRLARLVRQEKPDVIHGYLGGPNVLSVALKPFVPRTRVVWGLRASALDLARYDRFSRLVLRAEALLARFADLVIVNSYEGRDFAAKRGLPLEKLVVVPNGIDTNRFRPDRGAGRRVRAAWGIDEEWKLVGVVGWLKPMKDHRNFLQAAAILAEHREDLRFVCVGDGRPEYRDELLALSQELGLEGRLIWAGARDDAPAVFNALDVAISSSSFGEGFPNTVGEAMACSVPCVVTDVGDSAVIVGKTGIVVPPKDPEALAESVCCVLDTTILDARKRILDEFSITALIRNTEKVLVETRER